MMVRDMAKITSRGLPPMSAWYRIQDGGTSSVMVGHVTLMHVVDYMSFFKPIASQLSSGRSTRSCMLHVAH